MSRSRKNRGLWVKGDTEQIKENAQDAVAELKVAELDVYMATTRQQYKDGLITDEAFEKIEACFRKIRDLLVKAKDMSDTELFQFLMDEDGEVLKTVVSSIQQMKGSNNANEENSNEPREEEPGQEEDYEEENPFN
jgi:hypothetical protein